MIELVMYGPTPSIIIDRLDSPPPEKTFKIPKNWLLDKKPARAGAFTPGIGIAAKILKTINAKSTNRILFRKVRSVQINFTLCQKFNIVLSYFDLASFDTERLA